MIAASLSPYVGIWATPPLTREDLEAIAALAVGVIVWGLILWCVTMSGSRGGLLVFMIVLGAWFIERYRWPGVVVGAIAAVVGETGVDALKSLAVIMLGFYATCAVFVFVLLGTLLRVTHRQEEAIAAIRNHEG